MNVIVVVTLFPGMVRFVEGVIVRPVPAVLEPVQNWLVPKVILFKVKVLFPEAPVELFQVTWTFATVIVS